MLDTTPPDAKPRFSEAPMRFIEWDALLTPEQCKRLINHSRLLLQRSTVSGSPRYVSNHRTSWDVELGNGIVSALIGQSAPWFEQVISATAEGRPWPFREPWKVIRYQPGEEYLPHHDWYPQHAQYTEDALALGGQRTTTVMVYLNDVTQGGTTDFPLLYRRVFPECGKLLAWQNLGPGGERLHNSLHQGIAPVSEDKWILTSWYRERPYTGPRNAP